MAAPAAAHTATLAAADFGTGGKVVASFVKGNAGNKRAFRCTQEVTVLASSKPAVVSARPVKGGHDFDVELRRPGKAGLTYEVGDAKRAVVFKVWKDQASVIR